MIRSRSVLKDKKGVTLVEMMVAMGVLLVVALAMMQVALVGISNNRRNSLRDEGTRLAEKYLNEIRSRSIANRTLMVGSSVTDTITVNFISNTVDFDVTQTIDNNDKTKWDTATVTVEWKWRGDTFNTTLQTLVETDVE